VVRGRSDTGELSLLAWREPGRERRANAVGRAVSDQDHDQTSERRFRRCTAINCGHEFSAAYTGQLWKKLNNNTLLTRNTSITDAVVLPLGVYAHANEYDYSR